jgi:hypothetical protein
MSLRIRSLVVASVVVSMLVGLDRTQAQCAKWTSDFSLAGTDTYVKALCTFDDGSGPALYVGGGFTIAGGIPCAHIARWNGTRWTPVGGGVDGDYDVNVSALVVFDDGTGPALIASGHFLTAGGRPANSIAKWDGTKWSALQTGLFWQQVETLTIFDDGTGPALYARIGSTVRKWNGRAWSTIGTLMHDYGWSAAMASFDDGSGPALYIGGYFDGVNGVVARNGARWNGATWEPIGITGNDFVYHFAVFNDGSGAHLYGGGQFSQGGIVTPHSLAQWDGATWLPFGPTTNEGSLISMTMFDDGHGRAIIGGLETPNGRSDLVKWDGTHFTFLGALLQGVPTTFATFDDGHGSALYMGNIASAGGISVDNIIRWDGSNWSSLGTSDGVGGVLGVVDAFAVYDDGAGEALYAAGTYLGGAPGVKSNGVVRWNGTRWSSVGGTSLALAPWSQIVALIGFDDGSGPKLYAGGYNIWSWDGSNWSVVGPGLHGNHAVYALAVYDDGSGPALYAGGSFYIGNDYGRICQVAKWDGTAWSPVLTSQGLNPVVCMQVFDDGTGPALFASAGDYDLGEGFIGTFARWNGHVWSPVQSAGWVAEVETMTVFDDGTGKSLYVGGGIVNYAALPFELEHSVARWNGKTWTYVGPPAHFEDTVSSLAAYDDGTGPALYAGGWFTAGETAYAAGNIAKLVHGTWLPIGEGLNHPVHAMTVFDFGAGKDLYVGGEFTTAGRYASSSIARLHGCW